MEIAVGYEPTVAEVLTALRANGRSARIRLVAGGWITVVAGLFLEVAAVAELGTPAVLLGTLFLLLGGFYLLVAAGMENLATREAARLCVPTTFAAGPDRYRFELSSGAGEGHWGLTKVIVSAECWTLAVANRVSLVVPKRVLDTTERAAFDAFLAGRDRKLVKTV
ncbi:YcxB family protein [Catellatospora tritici]|uniref:YcxB family protein n=1 Tax=Catellatospora tritici TaxID=2851566 RepID=UPI001C2D65F2|nr:YcxB family protein [Catellatospora tritici]MBV1849173.1 YcxB family protein [Catellatospora tritici]